MSCSFILQICVKKNIIITGHSLWETSSVEGQWGKTGLRLVEILGLPVTMTGNFCKILLYIQWCDR